VAFRLFFYSCAEKNSRYIWDKSTVLFPKTFFTMLFNNPEEVLFQWVSRVCCGNPEDIAALYHEDAVLIPTFSPHTVTSPDGVKGYFEQLATRDGLGVRLHNKAVRKQPLSETLHTISGIYSFEFEVDQVLLSFPSRFSFVIDITFDRPIVHHHSSQVPRNLS